MRLNNFTQFKAYVDNQAGLSVTNKREATDNTGQAKQNDLNLRNESNTDCRRYVFLESDLQTLKGLGIEKHNAITELVQYARMKIYERRREIKT